MGFEYQLLDLTANEKSPRGQTSLAVQAGQPSVWQPNDIAPPEVPVTVWLDPAETGHSFTVWSQAPGGPERFVQVTAQRGSDSGTGVVLADGSYRWLAARSAWIQSTVGYGMQLWLTRDADNAGSGTYQHAGQGYQGGHPATWSATSAFPSLPDSARNLQARTFHINGARYGHTFSVVHPDTYQVSVNLGGWGTVWAGDGLSMSYMEGSAQIDANQPGWYLYDETLQEACSTETTSIFDGWPDFPGAAQNTLSLTIFGWRSGHILKLRQFNAAAQEIRSFDFGTHGWDILPGSLWLEPSDSAPFEVPYFSITMPTDLILGSDPNDPGTNRGFLVEDQTVQDLSGFFPVVGLGSGAIDLSRWYTPPVEQPYSLSSTRFFHDLVIRCTNGEEYPLTDRATQGDISWGAWGDAWWNAWGFFTANGRHRDGFAHWLIDRSTGEILPLGATSYIADWVSNDTPQNLVASTEGQDSIRITWAPVAGIEGPSSYQVWRKRADWGYWQSMGFSPNGDQAFTDAGVAFGVTYTYRVQTSYDQGRSLPSNEVSLANSDLTRDSDQDGIPDWWEFAVMNGSRFWGWVNGPPYLALYENGVDPLTVDIDEDGLPDWLEIQLGTSKDNPDSDYDGLSDKWELDHGTNPWIADSDGDGATDGEEAAAGTNPKSTASHPPVLRSVFRNVYYDFYDYPSDSQYPDHGTLDKTASWDPTLNTNEADAAISAPVALTTLSANLAQTAFPATLPALSATGELLTHAQSSVGLGPVVCPHAQITHRRYWLTVAPAATAPIERTFVIETRRTVNNDVKPPTVRTQTVTIPVGQTASAPFDIITALPVDPEQPVNHYEYMEETPLPVEIAGDNDDDGDIDQADRQARDKHPIVLQRKLNKTNTARTLIVRKIALSGVPVKLVKTGDEKIIIKSKQTGAVLMSEAQSESSDIGSFVSQADYEITVEGVDNGKGTIGLKVGDSATPADPMPIRVLNADVIFRNGSQRLADLIGANVSHGGLDSGDGNVHDIGGAGPETLTLAQFYARAVTAIKRRVSFKQTNYMAGRIWEKLFDNMLAGTFDNPTGAKPWNIFTTSDNYATSNCLEWLQKQWRRAVTEVHAELQDSQQKTSFESAYYSGASVKELAPADLLKTIRGSGTQVLTYINTLIAGADYYGKGDVDPNVFHNEWEGFTILVDPIGPVIEGQIRTITPNSYFNSGYFQEVPY